MAYGIVHHFPGGTKEQSETSDRGGASRQRQPAERPNLPRCRSQRLMAGWSWRSTTPKRGPGDVARRHPGARKSSRRSKAGFAAPPGQQFELSPTSKRDSLVQDRSGSFAAFGRTVGLQFSSVCEMIVILKKPHGLYTPCKHPPFSG